ncbi:MAG TPA: hypothetical protein VHV28_05450, partial [Solirubrobacteraceae bacterium]|nr:hypothetical protein [Solirubrobacteraceae bacterium]
MSRAAPAVRTAAAPAPPLPADATAGPPPVVGVLSGAAGLAGSGAERAGRGAAAPCREGTGERRTGAGAGSGGRAVRADDDADHDAAAAGGIERYLELAGAACRVSVPRRRPAPRPTCRRCVVAPGTRSAPCGRAPTAPSGSVGGGSAPEAGISGETDGHPIGSRIPSPGTGTGTGAGGDALGATEVKNEVHPPSHGMETARIGRVGTAPITGAEATGIGASGMAVTGAIRTDAADAGITGRTGGPGSAPARAADAATGRGG